MLSVLAKDNTDDSAAFEKKAVACKEELDELESRLQDEAYREQVHYATKCHCDVAKFFQQKFKAMK